MNRLSLALLTLALTAAPIAALSQSSPTPAASGAMHSMASPKAMTHSAMGHSTASPSAMSHSAMSHSMASPGHMMASPGAMSHAMSSPSPHGT